jgi:hypothetical protein
MSSLDNPASLAALMAPVVDRLVISVSHAVDSEAMNALKGGHRFHPKALSLIAANLASGHMREQDLGTLSRYQHFGSHQPFLDGLQERGAIVLDADGSITPTQAGLEMAQNIARLQSTAVTALWQPRVNGVDRVAPLVAQCAAAAVADDSPLAQYAKQAWLPNDATTATKVWNDLTVLRMHRADAHAKAWAEAGLTALQMKDLEPGEQRDQIELRTNELAAPAWSPLSPSDGVVVLGELAALPGVGFPL